MPDERATQADFDAISAERDDDAVAPHCPCGWSAIYCYACGWSAIDESELEADPSETITVEEAIRYVRLRDEQIAHLRAEAADLRAGLERIINGTAVNDPKRLRTWAQIALDGAGRDA